MQVLSNDIPVIEVVAFIFKTYKSANSLADTLNDPEFSRLQYRLKGIVVPFLQLSGKLKKLGNVLTLGYVKKLEYTLAGFEPDHNIFEMLVFFFLVFSILFIFIHDLCSL